MIEPLSEYELGKLTDAGEVVRGGRIDQHWETPSVEPHYISLFSKKPKKNQVQFFDSQEALKHFDLRSVEFGNWMTQQDRANFLYGVTISLHDLAKALQIDEKRIGMGGRLSIALGARGTGGPAGAHYENYTRTVINIAKSTQGGSSYAKGQGAVAHEFAHAFDNIVSKGLQSNETYISGGRSTRKGIDKDLLKNGNWFEKNFEKLFKQLYWTKKGDKTEFHQLLTTGDMAESEYLNRRNEVWARTFEVYTLLKIRKRRIKNEFLVDANYENDRRYPTEAVVKDLMPLIDRIMREGLKIIRTTGLSGIATGVSGYAGFRKVIRTNGSLDDTLAHMKLMALRDAHQVTQLAQALKGATVEETSENIWNYLRENTAYKLDTDGIEELRTPAASIHDGHRGLSDDRYGIDCDDYTILVSALLINLGINHEYRVTAYKSKGKFEHIYPVAFDENGNSFVIDCVPEIDYFNQEAQPIIDLKTVPMEIHELSGIGAIDNGSELEEDLNQPFELGSVDQQDTDDILDAGFLQGLEEVPEEEAEIVLSGAEANDMIETGLLAEVVKAKETLIREVQAPTELSNLIDVNAELERLNDLAEAWEDQDERADIIAEAIKNGSSYANFYKGLMFSLNELEEELNGMEDDEPIYLARVDMAEMVEDIDEDEDDLGFIRRRRSRTRRTTRRTSQPMKKGRLKNLFRKVGSRLKKGVKAVVRFNPATITLRNSILASLKTNALGISSKLIYGYMTESQIRQANIDLAEWKKIREALIKGEAAFKKLGGKAKSFRNAIVKGRARQKTGINLNGVGAVPIVGGIIKMVSGLLKKVKIGKLLSRKNKTPQEAALVREEGGTSVATQVPSTMPSNEIEPMDEQDQGMMDKAKGWIEENQKALTGVGLAVASLIFILLIVRMVKNKRKHKKTVAGLKGAITREKNRNKRKPTTSRRRKTTPRKKPTPRRKPTRKSTPSKYQLGKGKTNNKNRFQRMHTKAKQLQKKHPKTKYSTLLSKASKMI